MNNTGSSSSTKYSMLRIKFLGFLKGFTIYGQSGQVGMCPEPFEHFCLLSPRRIYMKLDYNWPMVFEELYETVIL